MTDPEPTLHDVLDAMQAVIDQFRGTLTAAAGPAPPLVPLKTAATKLAKSDRTLRRLATAGKINGTVKVGGQWRFDLSKIGERS